MDKTPYPLDTLKSWDLSGGGKFTLDALEFSPDIQDLLDEVELILSASEARLKDAPSESAPSEILRNKSPAVVPDSNDIVKEQPPTAVAVGIPKSLTIVIPPFLKRQGVIRHWSSVR